ncbi:hypothetical protein HMI55_004696 [Coelomomyces lativittatus]|nr:hypothetical protein HMI55_004696 [Coelomomyces lativittatus]
MTRPLALPQYSTFVRRDTFSFLPYPIQGILFLCYYPTLLRLALMYLLVSAFLGCLFSLMFLFMVFPFHIQVFMHQFSLSSFTALLLALTCTLIELALLSFFYLSILSSWYLDRLFLNILQLHHIPTSNPLTSWMVSCGRWIRVVGGVRLFWGLLTFPLHAIPVLGTLVWAWINGIILIWQYHQFWFDIYGVEYKAQKNWVVRHLPEYTRSGILGMFAHSIFIFIFHLFLSCGFNDE